jgi:hypothetical protein
LEGEQMRLLRPLLGYTKLGHKKFEYKGKIESTNHSKRKSNLSEELERAHRKDA